MVKTILYTTFFILFSSCGDDDPARSTGLRYSGAIPRFSVDPLEGGSLDERITQKSKSSRKGFFARIFSFPKAFAQEAAIDCSKEIDNWNDSPQLIGRANTNSALDFVETFYAQSLFYDCNARQQVQEDGVAASTQTDDGETPLDAEDDESLPILTASIINEAAPEDFTRFVSWTNLPDLSDNVSGKLVNKYLQPEDNARTKTRVDLAIEEGLREINSFLYVHTDTDDNSHFYIKAHFKEVDSNDDDTVDQHIISGRYWDSTDETIVVIRANIRLNVGSSVFITRCTSASDFNATCHSSGAAETEFYYDTEGEAIATEGEASTAGLATDQSSANFTTIGSDDDNFYTGTTEAAFFDPSFDVNA